MSTPPPPLPLPVSRRLLPLQLERVVSNSSQVSRLSSADTGRASPASGMHRVSKRGGSIDLTR